MAVDLGIEHLRDIELIGRGGFSVVYAATDGRTGRRVAVKVIHAVNDRIERSFERERAVMARLSAHPNVVTLYDSGYSPDGRPYLSMELVEGGTLADRVSRQGPLPWRVAVNLLLPIAGALEFAHRQQVLHRDVKPENILQSGDQARLTDFGIASLRDASGYTTTQVAASWGYTAPETLENQRDERSDLYSLGSTLHMLVTGAPPFATGATDSIQSLMYRLVNQPPPRLPPGLGPAALDDVLQACLAKDPDRRPQTAAALIDQLRPLLPASPALPPRRPVRVESEPSPAPSEPEPEPEPESEPGAGPPDQEARIEPAGAAGAPPSVLGRRRRARASPLAAAAVLVGVGAVALAVSLLTGADPAPPAPAVAESAAASSVPPAGGGEVTLDGHRGAVGRLVALADGRFVSASVDRTVRVWDPARPDVFPLVLRGLPGPVADVAALGDGRLALAGTDGTVTIWQPAGGGAEPVALTGHTGAVTGLAVLSGGRLVSAGDDGTVRIWTSGAAPAVEPVVLRGAGVAVTALAALTDGRVAGGTADGAVLIWDPATPEAEPLAVTRVAGASSVTALIELGDGRLAAGGTDGTVHLWDPAAPDRPGPVLDDHTGAVAALAALGDGRVASAGADGSVKVWDPEEIPLGVRTVYRPEGPVSALAVLPDGRLATAGGDGWAIHLWRAPSSGS
ncbi:MAG: serine/threonine-protein kinase [Acidimicrobiales bacterium]